jgi:hypothetical protein
VHRGVVESFSATLLVEGGGNQLICGSWSHLLKTSMRRRKEVHTRALTRLASPGVAKGVNGPPKSGFSPCRSTVSFCSFSFWSFGLLSPKRTQLRVLLVIVFHEVGFSDYISRPPATLKRTESTTRVLPLLTIVPPPPRLQPDRYRCRMDLPGPTTSVGTRTDYSVGPWDYPSCATRHLMAWSTRTTEEKYSVRKLYMSRTVWKTPRRTRLVLSPYSDL